MKSNCPPRPTVRTASATANTRALKSSATSAIITLIVSLLRYQERRTTMTTKIKFMDEIHEEKFASIGAKMKKQR